MSRVAGVNGVGVRRLSGVSRRQRIAGAALLVVGGLGSTYLQMLRSPNAYATACTNAADEASLNAAIAAVNAGTCDTIDFTANVTMTANLTKVVIYCKGSRGIERIRNAPTDLARSTAKFTKHRCSKHHCNIRSGTFIHAFCSDGLDAACALINFHAHDNKETPGLGILHNVTDLDWLHQPCLRIQHATTNSNNLVGPQIMCYSQDRNTQACMRIKHVSVLVQGPSLLIIRYKMRVRCLRRRITISFSSLVIHNVWDRSST